MRLDIDRLHTQWVAETPEEKQTLSAFTEYLKQQQSLQANLQQPRRHPKDAKIVPFEPIKEPWSEYILADGNILRIRTNLIAVKDMGTTGADKVPNYFVRTNLSVGGFTREEYPIEGR